MNKSEILFPSFSPFFSIFFFLSKTWAWQGDDGKNLGAGSALRWNLVIRHHLMRGLSKEAPAQLPALAIRRQERAGCAATAAAAEFHILRGLDSWSYCHEWPVFAACLAEGREREAVEEKRELEKPNVKCGVSDILSLLFCLEKVLTFQRYFSWLLCALDMSWGHQKHLCALEVQ